MVTKNGKERERNVNEKIKKKKKKNDQIKDDECQIGSQQKNEKLRSEKMYKCEEI